MIQAVVCDFGGVLSTPLAGSFAKWSAHSGLPAEALGNAIAAACEADGTHPLHELECGRLTEREFFARLEAHAGAPLHEFADIYWSHLKPNEPMIRLMGELRSERGYRMALLTNNVREWEPRWRAMFPVEQIFELVVDSSVVGLRKPDREIYQLTVERLGVPATECLLVDDFAHNCEAAQEMGMHAVRFQDNDQAIAEIESALAAGRARLVAGSPRARWAERSGG